MFRNSLLFTFLLAAILAVSACSGSNEQRKAKALSHVLDPSAYGSELDKYVSNEHLTAEEGSLIRSFVSDNAAQWPSPATWSYEEVLRRAMGREKMKNEGISGEVLEMMPGSDAEAAANPNILNISLSMRFTNKTGHNMSNFSVWLEFFDPEGNPYCSTNYFTYLRVFLSESRSEKVPFRFQAMKNAPGDPGKHFKAVLENAEPLNVVFHLAQAQFENGQDLNTFWLDPTH